MHLAALLLEALPDIDTTRLDIHGESIETWCELLQSSGRPALLERLCGIGIATPPLRQRVANSLGRAVRDGRCGRNIAPGPAPLSGRRGHDVATVDNWDGDSDEGIAPTQKRILFYTPQLCERGTEVAVYDYADGAELILGMQAWVAYDAYAWNNFEGTVDRFERRFGIRLVALERGFDDVDGVLQRHGIRLLHCLRAEGLSSHVSRVPGVRTLVHAVFDGSDTREGDVHARISDSVPGSAEVVPHIVRPISQPFDGPCLRNELHIPEDAIVFGRHGAYETFDIEIAREAVMAIATVRPDVYFLLLHTPPFAQPPLPNIIHLPRTSDPERKAAFLRTCDAMVRRAAARMRNRIQ